MRNLFSHIKQKKKRPPMLNKKKKPQLDIYQRSNGRKGNQRFDKFLLSRWKRRSSLSASWFLFVNKQIWRFYWWLLKIKKKKQRTNRKTNKKKNVLEICFCSLEKSVILCGNVAGGKSLRLVKVSILLSPITQSPKTEKQKSVLELSRCACRIKCKKCKN